ncbi:substrate-binding domain-containing protein [Paenibacillus athensensis]|uniref:Periplasmic binding protein domain-containing protein n=1 Tax=Paenibacillus athensensis TaxID=1967502 RepID=A0A4Y8Q7H8_9BACL|nr:substrate-binding domain-containing protein [Paenibacillus athensensis]MCD1257300.1 substrate-binding domain-containing protein [Paenibacillus athensensis]
MKRLIMIAIIASSCLALTFSLYYMLTVYQSDLGMSSGGAPMTQAQAKRIVIISQEQGSFMMNEIQQGAREAAQVHQVMIDFWGVYRSNLEELVQQVDIAIASKVDGIIVEGVDDPEFERIVSKATSRGIPVITINSDAPHSLRKAYVGSDHHQEGIVLGEYIAAQLKGQGQVGVIRNATGSAADDLRLKGLSEVLERYSGMKLVFASDDTITGQPNMQVYDILNHYPQVSAFVSLPTASGESIVQAVYSRSRVDEYPIFLFDDSPQTTMLIDKGMLLAGLSPHYEDMGRMSVDLVVGWLDGTKLPLNDSYFTPIRVVTASGEGGDAR